MEQRKIIFCIDKLLRGGTELQLTGLIEHLDTAIYKIYLLTIQPTDLALIPDECIHLEWRIPKLFSINGIRAILKLARFIKAEKIDIVQTFFQDSTVVGGLAGWLASARLRIASFRDLAFWATPMQWLSMRLVYRVMTHFITNSHLVKNHFVQKFSIAEKKITVIPNGINIAAFSFHEPLSNPEIRIGIVGNMSRKVKRTDLFIDAAAKVVEVIPQSTFHVIGDGELRGELQHQAASLGISTKVIFTGRIIDISHYLETIDIGVICSDSEGLSNAIIEYMLKGCCVVATNVGGNPELIEHETTGILIPPGNAGLLAEALVKTALDQELRKRYIYNARKKAEKLYSWENCVKLYSEVYCQRLTGNT